MTHPYRDLPPQQHWTRAMSGVAPGHADPAAGAPRIGRDERVATLGSCFAQHIARHLQASGCRYDVPEAAPPGLPAEAVQAQQYGLFSCRYGNVYTVRQALQLFDRACSGWQPAETAWQRPDGRWVDPFRPQVQPEGWADPAAVQAARQAHLGHVRTMFQRARWIVFTLGLTEAWVDRRDGAVFPLAPGVSAGTYDPARQAFVNFGVDEVRADLDALVARVRALNPDCRWLLTVSPVPLMATAEPRHVWTSTTVSKAVLRVACDEAERRHAKVHYFPSYEIVTSPAAGGRYYADDLRQVTEAGVQHVMRLFTRHCLDGEAAPAAPAQALVGNIADVVCDEETIAQALRALDNPRSP